MKDIGILLLALLPLGGFFAALLIYRRISEPFQPSGKPVDWGLHPDDRQWEKDALESTHQTLNRVSNAAKAWGESIAALLGVFGIVAFIKGPDAVEDLDPVWGITTVVLILIAVLLAVVAIMLAALAAQGTPRFSRQLDGWSLKQWHRASVQSAVRLLTWSRILACCSVLSLVGAMSVSWLSSVDQSDADSPAISLLLIDENGELICVDASESRINPDSRIVAVFDVEECP